MAAKEKKVERPEDDEDEFCEGGAPRKRRRHGGEATGDVSQSRADRRARGGKLTAAKRNTMPASEFALPGKGAGPEGKGSGAYPIDTPARARSALSRGAANATPSQDATIKRAVEEKYPSMDVAS